MATRAASSRSAIVVRAPAPVRRSGFHPKIVKAEARLRALGRKARDISDDMESALISVAVPTVLGMLQAKGTTLPTFGGYHPMLIWGAPLAFLGPRFIGGKWGKRAGAAGVGMLAVAGNRCGNTGSFKIAGDDDESTGDDDESTGDDDE